MSFIPVLVVFFVLLLILLAFFLQYKEEKDAELTEKVRISDLQLELERLQAIPEWEVNWLRGEGFDVKKAIFACEKGLLIRMDVAK